MDIKTKYDGELLVGQAHIIDTNDPKKTIKYLISAPTMRVPQDVSTTPNSYLAFRACLRAVSKHNRLVTEGTKEGSLIKSVLCCGLATAIGLMSGENCARQMLKAYETVALGRVFPYSSLAGFEVDHRVLVGQHNLLKETLPQKTKNN